MRKFLAEIMAALKTRTGKNTQIAFAGQAAAAAVGYLINILIIRRLHIDDYGTFSLFFSVCMLFAGFMHMGWMESYVRFGSEYANKPEFKAVDRFFFRRILFFGLVITLIAACLAPWISERLYHRKDFTGYFLLGILCAFVTCQFNYLINYFRVHQSFKAYTGINLTSTLLRLALCLVVVYSGIKILEPIMIIYILVPALSIIIGQYYIHTHFRPQDTQALPLDSGSISKFKSYNTWIFISMITTHLIGNLDTQFLAYYHSNRTLAAFSVAARLTLPIQFIIMAITATILPRLSAGNGDKDIRLYLSKLKFFLIPSTILMLLACWLLPPVFIWLAGRAYTDITLLLRLQIMLSLCMMLTNPIGLVLYVWGWSRGFVYLNVVQLVVYVILNFMLAPKYGAEGVVTASLIVHIIGLIYVNMAVAYKMRTKVLFQNSG